MKALSLRRVALMPVLLFAAVACDSDSSLTGPAVPSISGNWRGTWDGAAVTLTLQQTGSAVAGTLNYGNTAFVVAGTIDEFGVFAWSSDTDQALCMSFATTGNHLVTSNQASHLEGAVRRVRRVSGTCGEAGGRFENSGGTMIIDRIT